MKSLVLFLAVACMAIPARTVNILTGRGVSCAEKKGVVDTHNTLRGWIANGTNTSPRQPKAGNMQTIVWDDGLEEVAQGWADKMILDHNPNKNDPRWPDIGENVAWGTDPKFDFTRAILLFFDEYKNYAFGPMTMSAFVPPLVAGHYTQVVWAKSIYIGCGASYFNNTDDGRQYRFYVCNYGPSGNYIGAKPYYPGSQCSGLCCSGQCHTFYGNCTDELTTTPPPNTTPPSSAASVPI